MFFGLSLSPSGWLYAFLGALFVILAPMFVVETFAKTFDDPIRTIIIIGGNYILFPMLLSHWYRYKIRTTGKGSAIFIFYFYLFLIFFLIQLFHPKMTLDYAIGFVLFGGMLIYMYSTIRSSKKMLNEMYEQAKEEEIQMQTEAIIRANKIMEKEA